MNPSTADSSKIFLENTAESFCSPVSLMGGLVEYGFPVFVGLLIALAILGLVHKRKYRKIIWHLRIFTLTLGGMIAVAYIIIRFL